MRWATGGGDIGRGQVLFAALYLLSQALALGLTISAGAVPPAFLPLLAASKRLHSIYVLRLFNDCWSATMVRQRRETVRSPSFPQPPSHPHASLSIFSSISLSPFQAYAAAALFLTGHVSTAILAFSAAVSVKMSALLFGPPVLVAALRWSSPRAVSLGVAAGAALQVALAAPFLAAQPWSYAARAFELSRAFLYT